jgi:hypothetical protein
MVVCLLRPPDEVQSAAQLAKHCGLLVQRSSALCALCCTLQVVL